jgi:hypothetical protein
MSPTPASTHVRKAGRKVVYQSLISSEERKRIEKVSAIPIRDHRVETHAVLGDVLGT